MSVVDATHSPSITTEKVEKEVKEFSSKVDSLEKAASYTSLIGLTLGPLLAISAGPAALIIGAALASLATASLKVYSQKKKKELNNEISILENQEKVKSSDLSKLKSDLEQVYNPPK